MASQLQTRFIVIEPMRTSCDYYARPLDRLARLRLLAIGTRRGVAGVRAEVTRLKPAIGLVAYAALKIFSDFRAESIRFALHPWLDGWARSQMRPGEHVLSSYGYANSCFAFARQTGGRTFLDAGNSHPDNFWNVLSEELQRWKSPHTPVARHHYERSRAMLEHTDFILAPSSFVAKSYLDRGFAPGRVLRNSFPVNLDCFSPSPAPRPKNRPPTIISTGRLSLRKGTPYLFEAFRLIHARHPSARFLLTRDCETNARPVLAKYNDLPIEWSPSLPHAQLAERLRSADIFVLPSLEDGFAVTVAEALACGLPVITTPNTGASDLVAPGRSGEVVPIRDAKAIAEAVLAWSDRLLASERPPVRLIEAEKLSVETFERTFLGQLAALGLAS